MKLTKQQTAFVDALLNTKDNIALVARAGTGKTSTILAAVEQYAKAFPEHEITICAFGKGIQREIAEKLTGLGLGDWRKYTAATSHSMGWGLVKFTFRLDHKAIDERKILNIVEAQETPICDQYSGTIRELVHLAKTEGFGYFDDVQVGDIGAWYDLASHYAVNGLDDTSTMDRIVAAAQNVYRLSLAQTSVIDFDDMILFPLVKNIHVKFTRDLLIVDEAQDTSRARRALLKKFVKRRGGRMIVVGDDRQAIMGFAGASADALEELIEDLHATVLPLTMTWRCPKSVVAMAQTIVPDITASETAKEGQVLTVETLPETLEPTDAILCRNTSPLVMQAYDLIRRGIACKVEGRAIGNGLLKVVNRWKRVTTIAAFLDKLDDLTDREIQKAFAKRKEDKILELEDRRDTLVVICQAVKDKGLHDLVDVRAFIDDLFDDDVRGVVTLCTYHRSKGREWPRVMLIEHAARCPSKWAKQAWELRQEANLAYVAITRAQDVLMFINPRPKGG